MKTQALALLIATSTAVGLVAGPDETSRDWNEFRGPDGNGVLALPVPVRFGETQNLRWKIAIHGRGFSSPVIEGKRVWLTTSTEDGRELWVICVRHPSRRHRAQPKGLR